jgi:hypothetical protein
MKSFKPLVPGALALLLAGSAAAAQTVYRCGNSYSQSPCAGAVAVQADDPRTEAQRAAAGEALARDKALAKEMEASRRKEEARMLAADKLALSRAEAEHKKQEKLVVAKRPGVGNKRKAKIVHAEPDVFTAVSGSPKKKAAKP